MDSIQGVPALVIAQDVGGQYNPGSIEMDLGTSNADAVTVTVFGRFSFGELDDVATSIVSQWRNAATR